MVFWVAAVQKMKIGQSLGCRGAVRLIVFLWKNKHCLDSFPSGGLRSWSQPSLVVNTWTGKCGPPGRPLGWAGLSFREKRCFMQSPWAGCVVQVWQKPPQRLGSWRQNKLISLRRELTRVADRLVCWAQFQGWLGLKKSVAWETWRWG